MSSGDAVFRWIQSVARSTAAKSGTGAPRQEYLIRHTLESFLDRLSRTSHAGNFVLKGGILLAAYRVRRPTKDADSNAVNADITTENLAQVVRDIAAVPRAILERGITSTRWRDYVDIVELARHGIDDNEPLRSARAVARHRGVTLEPVAPHLAGYGAVAQAKWAAWRRKEHLESECEERVDDQITLVASCLDPVFVKGPESTDSQSATRVVIPVNSPNILHRRRTRRCEPPA